jgi:HEAT repeat protein
LLENPKTRMAAFKALREIAAQGQKSKGVDRAALSAREALAAQADPTVRPALLQDLNATRPDLRQSAALGLTRLGDFENAATALADDDADVRTSVACAIIGPS